MPAGRAYIGTSGWNYRHWRGEFYPEKLPQKQWLSHFATQFPTVEINASFYRVPRPEHVERWAKKVPRGFRFALKLWRGVTHYKKLVNAAGALETFFEAADRLDSRRRGPLLVQLPPSQGRDLDKLNRFMDELREASHGRWKVVFEFRHPEWLCDDTYKELDRQRAAICLHDMQDACPTDEPNDASFVYVRRHGPSEERYSGSYSASHIERDAGRIREWLKQGKTVFVYYNNDIGGHAVRNARQLQEAVGAG